MDLENETTRIIIMVFGFVIAAALIGIIIAYINIRKKMKNEDVIRIENLRKGTAEKSFSWDVFYQKHNYINGNLPYKCH